MQWSEFFTNYQPQTVTGIDTVIVAANTLAPPAVASPARNHHLRRAFCCIAGK